MASISALLGPMPAHVGQAEEARQLVAVGQVFREMLPCVDEQDRGRGVDVGNQGQQHGALGAERRDDGDTAGKLLADGAAQRHGAGVAGTQAGDFRGDAEVEVNTTGRGRCNRTRRTLIRWERTGKAPTAKGDIRS